MSEMNQIYTPKACQGKDAAFSGQVIMRIPTYEERIDLMCESGSVDASEGEMSKKQMLQMTKSLVSASYKFYVKVDITHKASKKHFTTSESLRYSAKTAEILSDVATWLLNADSLGEN